MSNTFPGLLPGVRRQDVIAPVLAMRARSLFDDWREQEPRIGYGENGLSSRGGAEFYSPVVHALRGSGSGSPLPRHVGAGFTFDLCPDAGLTQARRAAKRGAGGALCETFLCIDNRCGCRGRGRCRCCGRRGTGRGETRCRGAGRKQGCGRTRRWLHAWWRLLWRGRVRQGEGGSRRQGRRRRLSLSTHEEGQGSQGEGRFLSTAEKLDQGGGPQTRHRPRRFRPLKV